MLARPRTLCSVGNPDAHREAAMAAPLLGVRDSEQGKWREALTRLVDNDTRLAVDAASGVGRWSGGLILSLCSKADSSSASSMMRSRTSSGMRFQPRSGLGCRSSRASGPPGLVQIVPAVEDGARDANLFQHLRRSGKVDSAVRSQASRRRGTSLWHSPPSAVTLFLSRRFSRVSSATPSAR
jgi:hypothetical protein